MDLLSVLKSTVATKNDDDYVDRLNHIYTAILLILFSVVVTTHQYVGRPIDCWCPAQFTGGYVVYANNVCWVKNTYYIPMDQSVPETDWQNKPQLRYYQWVPFILMSFALLYQLPCYIWRGNNERSGINLENIVRLSNFHIENGLMQGKDCSVKMLIKHFERYLEMRKRWSWSFKKGRLAELVKILCFWTGRKYGNFLSHLYVFTKLLYFVNALAQFFVTDILLTGGIQFYGARLLRNFATGNAFDESAYFPRVTLCDFHIREVGFEVVGHRYTVQCLLSINLFSEVIFGFYWFWLVFLIMCNVFSLTKWTYYLFSPFHALRYVRKHIRAELQTGDSPIEDFAKNFLKSDGLFALRIISQNAGDMIVTDVLSALYENYKIRKQAN